MSFSDLWSFLEDIHFPATGLSVLSGVLLWGKGNRDRDKGFSGDKIPEGSF